jgi:hypothetical protein
VTTSQRPFNFFALVGPTDAPVAHEVPVTAALQRELSKEFDKQFAEFGMDDAERVQYDPQYRPGDGEIFEVEFALPQTIPNLAQPPAMVALPDEAIEQGTLRALVGVRQAAAGEEPVYCFQTVDGRQLLRRSKLTIIRSHDVFAQNDSSGVVVRDALTAVYRDGKLYFQSEPAVRRFLDLSLLFTEATNPQVEAFFGQSAFAVDDLAGLIALADKWMRRKVTSIAERNILKDVSPRSVVKVGKEFGIAITTRRLGSRTLLVPPTNKKDLKSFLRLLDQDYLASTLTVDRFQVNSKRRFTPGR